MADDQITRHIAVPAWMVYLLTTAGVGTVSVCFATIGGVIVQDRGRVNVLEESDKAQAVAINTLQMQQAEYNTDARAIRRDLETIKARMP